MTTRPDSNEYAPYYGKYIALVPEGDIAATLASQLESMLSLLRPLSEEQGNYSYAPGKWSIKQLLGHVMDSERVFACRALRIGRNDQTPLPGFEQDDYVANANFNARTLESLLQEFAAVRQASVQLFKHFTEEEWLRRGTANDNKVSCRALAYIIAGHSIHHTNMIESRYLNSAVAG